MNNSNSNKDNTFSPLKEDVLLDEFSVPNNQENDNIG